MKTIYYYYVLAVLGAVFSLNSCDTIESKEKVEERNRKATTAYLSDMYGGLSCEIEEIDVYGTDTLSAENFINGMEYALEVFGDVANKEQITLLYDMKRRLKGQPTIILCTYEVTYKIEFAPEKSRTELLYGLYNARSREFIVSDEYFGRWDKNIPKIYSEVITLIKALKNNVKN